MNESTPAYHILGAYGGVGSALSRAPANDGARLVLSGRDGDRLRSGSSSTRPAGRGTGYALAAESGDGILYDDELGIGACGDWCVEGRVAGALISGLQIARRLIRDIPPQARSGTGSPATS